MQIRDDDLTHPQTLDLLRIHLEGMHANTPAGHVFALDLSGLKQPNISVWTLWDGDIAIGIGALKQHDDGVGEIKSMRTHPGHLRKGVAAQILRHIIDAARQRGLTRLSLETGRGPEFEPAQAMYRRHGFVAGAAFADYRPSDYSAFFHLDL